MSTLDARRLWRDALVGFGFGLLIAVGTGLIIP